MNLPDQPGFNPDLEQSMLVEERRSILIDEYIRDESAAPMDFLECNENQFKASIVEIAHVALNPIEFSNEYLAGITRANIKFLVKLAAVQRAEEIIQREIF